MPYASAAYLARLEAASIRFPMAAVRCRDENAKAETFFKTLKRETVSLHDARATASAGRSFGVLRCERRSVSFPEPFIQNPQDRAEQPVYPEEVRDA